MIFLVYTWHWLVVVNLEALFSAIHFRVGKYFHQFHCHSPDHQNTHTHVDRCHYHLMRHYHYHFHIIIPLPALNWTNVCFSHCCELRLSPCFQSPWPWFTKISDWYCNRCRIHQSSWYPIAKPLLKTQTPVPVYFSNVALFTGQTNRSRDKTTFMLLDRLTDKWHFCRCTDQRVNDPSFFRTRTMFEANGLPDSLMTPASSISFRCCLTSSYIQGGIFLYDSLNGRSSSKVILCLTRSVFPIWNWLVENTGFHLLRSCLTCHNWSSFNLFVSICTPSPSQVDFLFSSGDLQVQSVAKLSTTFTSWILHMFDLGLIIKGFADMLHIFTGILIRELDWFNLLTLGQTEGAGCSSEV